MTFDEWAKTYIDTLLTLAQTSTDPMRTSILTRADYAMDVVLAWREAQKRDSESHSVRSPQQQQTEEREAD